MRPALIYIHGFNSSPLSEKAQEVRRYLESNALAIDFISPDLPNYPGEAYHRLAELIERELAGQRRKIAMIGSSLGGFMATALAGRFGLRAALVNPVVRPYELMQLLLGENQNPYTGETFFLHQGHSDELREIEPKQLARPEDLLLLSQTGDETLDYSQAAAYYADCQQVIEEGGDHRFQGFDRHIPAVLKFLGLV